MWGVGMNDRMDVRPVSIDGQVEEDFASPSPRSPQLPADVIDHA